MSEHFVEYINIERYKCFKGFSGEGFERVNLISGKNNVGKTALMEAIFVNVGQENAKEVLGRLDHINYLRTAMDSDESRTNNKKRSIELKKHAGSFRCKTSRGSVSFDYDDSEIIRSYKLTINNDSLDLSEEDMDAKRILENNPLSQIPTCYISSKGDSQENIINSFIAIQKKDRESEVYEYIKQFDDSVENVKIIGGDSIQCKVTDVNGESSYRSIKEFGDGLGHYLSIIADLFAAEGGYVFIDELDNGIHYSSLDKLWEIILMLSKELHVQVFATTHSKECIESYCRVVEKLEDKGISFTTLVRNKEKEVKAIVKGFDVFTNSIHSDREVRGW